MIRAVLFDIDGTLVDSVDLHAKAWQEAFARFGRRFTFEEVRSQIGKGGDQLLPHFLDEADRARFGEACERWRGERFSEAYLPRVRPFPGARALVARAKEAGLKVGLASSCKAPELEHHLDLVGIRDLVDAATTSDDVARTKPHPDVFAACAKKLGVHPRACVAVGDSPFDAIAARRAGCGAVGLLSGGFEGVDLVAAGCDAIFADAADLLRRFDGSPLAPRAAEGAGAGA